MQSEREASDEWGATLHRASTKAFNRYCEERYGSSVVWGEMGPWVKLLTGETFWLSSDLMQWHASWQVATKAARDRALEDALSECESYVEALLAQKAPGAASLSMCNHVGVVRALALRINALKGGSDE